MKMLLDETAFGKALRQCVKEIDERPSRGPIIRKDFFHEIKECYIRPIRILHSKLFEESIESDHFYIQALIEMISQSTKKELDLQISLTECQRNAIEKCSILFLINNFIGKTKFTDSNLFDEAASLVQDGENFVTMEKFSKLYNTNFWFVQRVKKEALPSVKSSNQEPERKKLKTVRECFGCYFQFYHQQEIIDHKPFCNKEKRPFMPHRAPSQFPRPTGHYNGNFRHPRQFQSVNPPPIIAPVRQPQPATPSPSANYQPVGLRSPLGTQQTSEAEISDLSTKLLQPSC